MRRLSLLYAYWQSVECLGRVKLILAIEQLIAIGLFQGNDVDLTTYRQPI